MNYTFRPLGPWLEPDTDPRRSRYTFKAPWSDTLNLLAYELDHLDARNIVLQADFREQDLRADGMPRSNARQPTHPGVRVAFDSKHGALTYATDSCEFWQHNVRSIGLGLEALRAVDRYGVTRRGEQYTGWKQLPSGIAMPAAMTVEDAVRFLLDAADDHLTGVGAVLTLPVTREAVYRRAAKLLHPDAGGDTAAFQRLQEAKRVLDDYAKTPTP
ncbi:MAG: J domain-containing protein [Chloroflexi bacterium]|nr:J domain-containing protein [Chloroflexota bacterium]